MERGLYLFCLARLSRLPTLPFPEKGLDGQNPLQVESFRDLAAVFCPVAVADFVGPEAEERLQDLTWIGPRVIRHQEVVAGVMRHSPVLPARFGTIFRSAASLEEVLRRRHDTIASCLDRLVGHEEWAVKGLLDRPRAKERLFTHRTTLEADRLEALSPGARYFQEQRLRAECDREMSDWLGEVCLKLWTGLRRQASEVRERRLLSRQVTGSDRDMVWNWAFLVSETDVHGFQALIRDANARYSEGGLGLECTGPWPPYSFTPALNLEPET
jgi:Gas vesicle synthesis protein GvpL/GvpF